MDAKDWNKPLSELRYIVDVPGKPPVEILYPELGDQLDRIAPVQGSKTQASPPSVKPDSSEPKAFVIDPTVEAAYRHETHQAVADAGKIAKKTLEQIDKNPKLKKAIMDASAATHVPKENLIALSWFESSGGAHLLNQDSGAQGPFQLMDRFYYTAVVKYGESDKAAIGRHAPEAARAFAKAAPYIELGDKGEIIFHNDKYMQATHSKHTIREDIAKYKDDFYVQAYFVGAQAREYSSFKLSEQRLVHNYGPAGARAILAADGKEPIANFLSQKKRSQNGIPDTISVQAFRDELIKPFVAVADATRQEMNEAVEVAHAHGGHKGKHEPKVAAGRRTRNTAELKKPAPSGAGPKGEAAAHTRTAPHRLPKMDG